MPDKLNNFVAVLPDTGGGLRIQTLVEDGRRVLHRTVFEDGHVLISAQGQFPWSRTQAEWDRRTAGLPLVEV